MDNRWCHREYCQVCLYVLSNFSYEIERLLTHSRSESYNLYRLSILRMPATPPPPPTPSTTSHPACCSGSASRTGRGVSPSSSLRTPSSASVQFPHGSPKATHLEPASLGTLVARVTTALQHAATI